MLIEGIECRVTQDHQHFFSVRFGTAVLGFGYTESEAIDEASLNIHNIKKELTNQ